MQVFLYDDQEMHVWEVTNFKPKPVEHTEIDITALEDNFSQSVIMPDCTFFTELTTKEQKAELDPTTMKRIAKYNLDKDFEGLNRNIEFAKKRLEHLNADIKTKEKKLDFMHNICQRIWNDDCFDEDKYTREEQEEWLGDEEWE